MVEDFSNLGLPPIHPFDLKVELMKDGYVLYVNGEFAGSYCSPYSIYVYIVTKLLPSKLYLNI